MSMKTFLALQVVSVAVAIGVVYALLPAGAEAGSAFLNVFISDKTDSTRFARVDSDGNLQVAGNLGITGTPSFEVAGTSSVQLVPTNPMSLQGSESSEGDTGVRAHLFDVPSGQVMVVESISVFVSVESGLTPWCVLETENDVLEGFFVPVVLQRTGGSSDFFVGALQTRVYAGTGGIRMECATGVFSDRSFVNAMVSGYLVDVSE